MSQATNPLIALIEIATWWQERPAYHFPEDGQGCILALLHSNLSDPWERPPVLVERCSVSKNKYIWMAGNCEVWLNSDAARTVHLTSDPFCRRRRSNAGRLSYRLCPNTFISDHRAISADCLNRLPKADVDTKRHHVLLRGFRLLLRKGPERAGRHVRKNDVD
jgi:hypothetical protein